MAENILLTVFAVLPIITGLLLYLYFRKISPHLKKVQWLRLVVGNILVFVFLCSPVLLLGEIYYRFLYDTTDSWGLTKVYSEWYHRYFQFNNCGMRDSTDYARELNGKPRITFIGDSFTAGHGIANVEDRFVNQIRAKRPDLEIHAFAMNGWDTYAHMVTVSKLIQAGYEFDHVVLVYNLNDISDIMEQWVEILDRVYSVEPGFLFKHSYFLNILYYRFYAACNPAILGYYNYIVDAYNGPLWEKHKERLTKLKAFFDSQKKDFMVVIFPFLDGLGPHYKYREIHEKLDVFWDSLGVPRLDLLSIYEPYPAKSLVVSSHDAHPNKKAHALAAEAIIKFINEHIVNQ